ncbi:MAG: NrdH-redoxin [Polyangiaceae bacterium]|nr:NrdH-redoxin [Polyangiaceae bacterium]
MWNSGRSPSTRLFAALAAAFAVLIAILLAASKVLAAEPDIEAFERSGCRHCEAAHRYLEDLRRRRPDLDIVERDVSADPTAIAELQREAERAKIGAVSFPTFRVRGQLIVGFDSPETTGGHIEALLAGQAEPKALERGPTCEIEAPEPCEAPVESDEVELPFFGRVAPSAWGLPLFTIAVGLLDGFNPCAMWVLLFLLAMLINLRSRGRILLVAGTFVAVSGLVYFAFMAAWLNVFVFVGLSRAVQIGLGVFAIVVGAIHVKDFFAPRKGVSLSIPASVKPTIYAHVRKIIGAKNLPLALASAMILAVMVNVVEMLCTAGLPAVYTQVLARQGLSTGARYAYLALYNVAYMLDDSIMVGIAVVTLGRRKLQERGGRFLKLVSGVTLFALGVALVVAPNILVW